MAFVTKKGSRFTVRQGNNFKVLSSFSSRSAALKERDRLHKKNKPKASAKGATARKKFNKQKRKR